ncbi:glycosyltransferase family 4 protein [Paenibacillus piri]|uniref:Glycosyltransferase family 1 protein n=1 Tax=Paenibacillus piri TaxID=2547395 RepID=A0A4R5KWB5_9BACL|nr:glycosyltransferase family 4 protein [Paenibacillus piri]TDG00310.1 glycosyltransferase family 1 protein [Paenibacillus piri]
MRIAWIGPMPNNDGGAVGVGRQLLLELSRQGVEVDCYFVGTEASVPDVLKKEGNLTFHCHPSSWQWNRWYSRNNYMAFVTGQFANLRCELKLAEELLRKHKQKPYDLVYQFSHIELHALRRFKKQLPPIVLHPEVHAAGELRWHRKEAHLAKVSESWITRSSIRLLLMARSFVQKRHIKDADYIMSISKNFADDLRTDYNLAPEKVAYIVPNPIDVERYYPNPGGSRSGTDGRLTFLFVSRLAVRKGVEMMVELSHRLDDISDQARIVIVGNYSLWSNYRGLLDRLNPKVAAYIGSVSGGDMAGLYHSADALIQPSHYEPFGLTVGEALACGLPVVTSDKVGAAEDVDPACCRVFPAGNMDELERHVRMLFHELRSPGKQAINETARSEAVRLFADPVVGEELVSILHEVCRSGAKRKAKPVSEGNMAVN